MASKKMVNSGSSRSYDRHRFISKEAQLTHNDNICTRPVIREREFGEYLIDIASFSNPINARAWHKHSKPPEPASLTLVREFYVNMCEYDKEEGTVWVRGKRVPFSVEAINQFYELPPIGKDEFSQMLDINVDRSVVERFLYRETATQARSDGDITFLRTNAFTGVAKIWLYFICARLMPCSHTSRVFRDRAILLYAILHGKTVNVGEVIFISIVEVAEKKKVALCCPHLITGLYINAGIRLGPHEELLEPAPALTTMTYNRLCRNKDRHEANKEPPSDNPSNRVEASSSRVARRSTQQVDDRMEHFIKYQVRCNELIAKTLNIHMDDFSKFDEDSSDESSMSF